MAMFVGSCNQLFVSFSFIPRADHQLIQNVVKMVNWLNQARLQLLHQVVSMYRVATLFRSHCMDFGFMLTEFHLAAIFGYRLYRSRCFQSDWSGRCLCFSRDKPRTDEWAVVRAITWGTSDHRCILLPLLGSSLPAAANTPIACMFISISMWFNRVCAAVICTVSVFHWVSLYIQFLHTGCALTASAVRHEFLSLELLVELQRFSVHRCLLKLEIIRPGEHQNSWLSRVAVALSALWGFTEEVSHIDGIEIDTLAELCGRDIVGTFWLHRRVIADWWNRDIITLAELCGREIVGTMGLYIRDIADWWNRDNHIGWVVWPWHCRHYGALQKRYRWLTEYR